MKMVWRKSIKTVALLTLSMMFAMALLSGCGGGSGTQSTTSSTAAESDADSQAQSTSEVTTDASAASGIDKIKEAGKLVMLTNAAFPPFEYLGSDNEVTGVDAELAKAVADEIGVELEIVDMDFDGIVPAIQAGSGDLGVAGITIDETRLEMVDFSINYVTTSQMIIVKEDSGYTSVDDLVGKSIGVQMGTTGDIYVGDIEDAQVSRFKTGPDAGLALSNGQIDAVVIDEMPAQQIAAANEGLTVLEEPLTDENYAIAIRKGNTDLKEVVDRVLQRMIDDGSLQALIDKHTAALAEQEPAA